MSEKSESESVGISQQQEPKPTQPDLINALRDETRYLLQQVRDGEKGLDWSGWEAIAQALEACLQRASR